jgi:hypothetical protein
MNLRPYQVEIARAVVASISGGNGLTFSVEIARQGGKNELSAHLELLLLTLYLARGGNIIKCSPTFKPQAIISRERLRQRLDDFGFAGAYRCYLGYIVELGNARVFFLSAEPTAAVVGHTADILLEIDEAQDVSKEKYSKEFRPMGSATNVTTILYGTTWDDTTLLEEVKQNNLELEKKDGIRRHFRYDWQEVGRYNPDYLSFVEGERQRLGEDHPLFRTQYALLPLPGRGRLLSRHQLALLLGEHPRQAQPHPGVTYVAGIDLAGEENACGNADSTVVTIAEVHTPSPSLSVLKVVEQYHWTGTPHSQLYLHLVEILTKWRCHRIVVDATGMGQPIASFLTKEFGSRLIPFVFTEKSKSELGFQLLSFINTNRLKLYRQDGSTQYQETLLELERARAQYRAGRTMNFYLDPSEGHDDFLISLALTVWASKDLAPRAARGSLRED